MSLRETLTSLAILKVNIDQGKDYLEYLRPFILQVLIDHRPSPVTERDVTNYLLTDFGFEIPSRTVQIILSRISRSGVLERSEGVYNIVKQPPDPKISIKKVEANRHIETILYGILNFRQDNYFPISTKNEAVSAICEFLSEFSIPCLRAYLKGTAIPKITGKRRAHIVLVSQYVINLQAHEPERFESFMILVQGHMLANALLCPDLQSTPKTYKGVTFYLDTPILIHRFGLEGEVRNRAIEELIVLLRELGANVDIFEHSYKELLRVIKGAAEHVDSPHGRGAIVTEARRRGTTKSDILLLLGKIDDLLNEAKIDVKETPKYIADFQIDEQAFEEILDDEVSYYNPRAREYDVNSVRSIYVLRKGHFSSSLEKCRAVLVTSNSGFSRAAFEYGKRHEESDQVSSVITDFSLANMAWLKAPMGAPSLPTTELIAYSYAALQPSKELLEKFLSEIDKLEKQGTITNKDHQLLRSSVFAQDELMQLTLGEESALTTETVTETLKRVTNEIKKEESEKLKEEQQAHEQTQKNLEKTKTERQALQKRLFWNCRRKARNYAWVISFLIAVLILIGILYGLGIVSTNRVVGWVLLIGMFMLALTTLANLCLGTTVKKIHQYIMERLLTRFLKHEAQATGIDLGEQE